MLGNNNVNWKKIYSSDLPRAARTASLIMENDSSSLNNDKDVEPCDLLKEICFGIRESLPRGTTIHEAIKIVAQKKNIKEENVIDNAETPEELHSRQGKFITKILDDLKPLLSTKDVEPVKILAVSHGGFIKQFFNNYTNVQGTITIDNCSINNMMITIDDDVDIKENNIDGKLFNHPSFNCIISSNEANINICDHLPTAINLYS
jgi:broad specificity phosphatase PhoE